MYPRYLALSLLVGLAISYLTACNAHQNHSEKALEPQPTQLAEASAANAQALDEQAAKAAQKQTTASGEASPPGPTDKLLVDAHNDEDGLAGTIRCEAKVEVDEKVYSIRSQGPTLEEARDSVNEDACAIPCSENLSQRKKGSPQDLDAALESCIESCIEKSNVIAVECKEGNNTVIYTEGAWSETGDAAPNTAEAYSNQPSE